MGTINEIVIKNTHRGLRYVDGRLTDVLEAGRYELPAASGRFGKRGPVVEVTLVDMRERELTLKGQEILTSDKVALRVSILTHFKVVDPVAAVERVDSYTDRVYSDVQLAARRSLASMTLEDILTNRNQLSEDILRDVQGAAAGYGVEILRADVKDIVFPGNLQEVMNRVLTAQRLAEAQLVDARTKAEKDVLEARARAEADQVTAAARRDATRLAAEADAAAQRIRVEAEVDALRRLAEAAAVYAEHPALLRLRELETMTALGGNAEARLYIGFDKHSTPN
ncbi:slipin family protein [Catellatospora paridis]|uniref:slipin family protein n=1 Tax=Catellatospora paridis TaxID=1617086 RepID=UPI0012D4BD7F|nr:slipin family protein [Catellatospora paridis]